LLFRHSSLFFVPSMSAVIRNTFLEFGAEVSGSRRRTVSEGRTQEMEPVPWVPGTVYLKKQEEKKQEIEPRKRKEITTMMLRNLPSGASYDEVDAHLKELSQGSFDALHVPADIKSGCNRGYAFVNFVSGDAYRQAAACLHGQRLPGYAGSSKVLEVAVAKVQGGGALRAMARGRQATGRKGR